LIAALTGVPGTGKSSVAAELRGRGFEVVDLHDLVERKGLWDHEDAERGSKIVDPRVLSEFLQPALREARARRQPIVLEGHLAHLVKGVEVAVVLRCHPAKVAERLRARGWVEAKVRENAQAEALDAITIEAAEEVRDVLEVDTSARAAGETAALVAALLATPSPEAWTAHRAGTISWGEEVLAWS